MTDSTDPISGPDADHADGRPARPRNVIVVLLDSLNRHLIGPYGAKEFATPNLDRLAARSVRFTRHVTGSLPCMPARHDLLVGAMDFLWRPWGSIEIWEDAITYQLRRAGVTTMLVSDHPHLFETGGENYHTDFGAWAYERGHEGDPWRTAPDPSFVGAPVRPGPIEHPYDTSRTYYRAEADYPGPRTMAAAADWLARQAPAADRFLLVVDEFDPHEPFDTPEPWASRYDDSAEPRIIWPPYVTDAIASGRVTPEDARRIRAAYGAKLSMIDHHLGRILDTLDARGGWDDTAVVLCTDHGHYLGEHDLFGKPAAPLHAPMRHIPLLVAWPGREPGDVDALTTTVDLFATLCDIFDVTPEHRTHGHSIVPLLEQRATSVRAAALTGIWGQWVHVTDGARTYARAPEDANAPLSMWSNRWSTMPIHAFPDIRLPRPDHRAWLDTMPGSDVPVIRQPFSPGDMLPFWGMGRMDGSHLWDGVEDPGETHDLVGTTAEAEMAELLRATLDELEAPEDQYARLGLA